METRIQIDGKLFSDADKARFWSKVKCRSSDECWDWLASVNNQGYGQFRPPWGGIRLAHRISYALEYGAVPSGMNVLHRCDNTRCVNPSHLFVGTMSENTQDMINKKRWKKPPTMSGTSHPMASLSEDQVRLIISDTRTLHLISLDYGVSETHVSRIKHRKAWKHVEVITA